jgi:heterodisulfide reductase subunit A
VSKIFKRNGRLVLKGVDTLSASQVELEVDMVVLGAAIMPQPGVEKLAQKLGVPYDKYGFLSEAHPKLRPVETASAGVFLAGACQAPKDIPDAVGQAGCAASKVLGLLSADEIERLPTVAKVNENNCIACWACLEACPYGAIEKKEIRDRKGNLIKMVAEVNDALCQGCGTCVAVCRSNSVDLKGFTDEEIFAELNAL